MTSISSPTSPASSVVEKEKTITEPTQPAEVNLDESNRLSNGDGNGDGNGFPRGEKNSESDAEQGEPTKPQGPPAFDPRQNPDGGVQAWLCLLGGFCTLFCSFGLINCVGVFQTYYQAATLREYSPSTIAWISSLMIFFMFFFGPIIGKLYDNYGPRWLLLVGTFLEVFGLMMLSLSTEYYQILLSQGICASVGASTIFYPAMSTTTTWFFKKRAFAFGIIAAGSSFGGVILPIMIERLIPIVGFGWTIRITAFMILFLMIIANLTIRSRMPPFKKPLKVFEFLRPFKELPFDLVAFGSFIFFLGMFLPINYIILEAIHYGMNPNLAQYMVSVLNAVSFFGRTVPGFIADKIGRFNMMVIMCGFTGIIILALWLPAKSNAPIIVFAALFGFGSGAFVSLAPSVIAQISDVEQIGVRTGSFFAVISIAALISQPIGGALITRWNGSYTGLQIYAGVLCVVGTFIILLARFRVGGFKPTAKI